MARRTDRERLSALEVFRSVHEKRLDELTEKLDAVTFYMKSVAWLAGIMAYHVVGGPYASVLGQLFGHLQ